jgi:hypothetical protein
MVALVGGLLGFGAGAKETSRLEKVERDEAFRKEKEKNARQLEGMRVALLRRRADQEDKRLGFEETAAQRQADAFRAKAFTDITAFGRGARPGQGMEGSATPELLAAETAFGQPGHFRREQFPAIEGDVAQPDDSVEPFDLDPTIRRLFVPPPSALEAQKSATAGATFANIRAQRREREAKARKLDREARGGITPKQARAGRAAERSALSALWKLTASADFNASPPGTQIAQLKGLVKSYNDEVKANRNTIYVKIAGKRVPVKLAVTRAKDQTGFTYSYVYLGPNGKLITVPIKTAEMKGILGQLAAKLPKVKVIPFKSSKELRKRGKTSGAPPAKKVIGEAVGTLVERAKLPPGRGGRAHARKMEKSRRHDARLQKQREIEAARAKALQGR